MSVLDEVSQTLAYSGISLKITCSTLYYGISILT